MAIEKTVVQWPDGSTVEAEQYGYFLLHKPIEDGAGYVVSHAKTLRCVIRCRTKTDARNAAKALSWVLDHFEARDVEKILRHVVQTHDNS